MWVALRFCRCGNRDRESRRFADEIAVSRPLFVAVGEKPYVTPDILLLLSKYGGLLPPILICQIFFLFFFFFYTLSDPAFLSFSCSLYTNVQQPTSSDKLPTVATSSGNSTSTFSGHTFWPYSSLSFSISFLHFSCSIFVFIPWFLYFFFAFFFFFTLFFPQWPAATPLFNVSSSLVFICALF